MLDWGVDVFSRLGMSLLCLFRSSTHWPCREKSVRSTQCCNTEVLLSLYQHSISRSEWGLSRREDSLSISQCLPAVLPPLYHLLVRTRASISSSSRSSDMRRKSEWEVSGYKQVEFSFASSREMNFLNSLPPSPSWLLVWGPRGREEQEGGERSDFNQSQCGADDVSLLMCLMGLMAEMFLSPALW